MNFTAALYDLVMDDGWDGLFTGNPVLEVYGETMPASPELAVPVGTSQFFVISLASPPWLSASNGVKEKNGTWQGLFNVGGSPTWFRIRNSDDAAGTDYTVPRIDGSLGTTSGADVMMSRATWVSGEAMEIETFSLVASIVANTSVSGRADIN